MPVSVFIFRNCNYHDLFRATVSWDELCLVSFFIRVACNFSVTFICFCVCFSLFLECSEILLPWRIYCFCLLANSVCELPFAPWIQCPANTVAVCPFMVSLISVLDFTFGTKIVSHTKFGQSFSLDFRTNSTPSSIMLWWRHNKVP
jgi:hypothetical protein